jgi:hypothetical protein
MNILIKGGLRPFQEEASSSRWRDQSFRNIPPSGTYSMSSPEGFSLGEEICVASSYNNLINRKNNRTQAFF